jgi:uncharacterized membrane protein YccC
MASLLEKLKSLLRGIDFKTILIVCLAVVVVTLVWLSWWSPKPPDVQQLLAEQRATLTKQFEANVKARDAQIKTLTARLTVSNGKYAALSKRLAEVRNETIVPPKTNKELRDRFVALGFPPR